MPSVAYGGTADRIAARTLFNVPRAGSGTPARYSSTSFGAAFALFILVDYHAAVRCAMWVGRLRLTPYSNSQRNPANSRHADPSTRRRLGVHGQSFRPASPL